VRLQGQDQLIRRQTQPRIVEFQCDLITPAAVIFEPPVQLLLKTRTGRIDGHRNHHDPDFKTAAHDDFFKVNAVVFLDLRGYAGDRNPSVHAPVPTPLPTPHMSVVFDPFDYIPIIGATITVCGMKRATAGTNGMTVHIPPGFPFAPKLPDSDDELFMGSSTVIADGDPFSYQAKD